MLSLVLILIFATSLTLFLVIESYVTDRSGVVKFKEKALASGATASEQELAQPFAERVIRPLVVFASRLVIRISPVGLVGTLRHRLELAGTPKGLNVDKLLALKALSSFFAFAIVGGINVLQATPSLKGMVSTALFTIVGFFLPDLWLNSKIKERQKAIRVALPDTLDLLTISVEAGLGFDSALKKVVSNTSGPLAEEFFRMLQEIQLGATRSQAFRGLGERTNVPELNSFIMAMLQADIFGISIGKVLRVQAQEMRTKRRQQAEEIAMKAPVKIVFPLVLCIFPALLVVVLGPAAISIYQAITQGI